MCVCLLVLVSLRRFVLCWLDNGNDDSDNYNDNGDDDDRATAAAELVKTRSPLDASQ